MIYWLSCAMAEMTLDAESISPSLSFLSEAEREMYRSFRFAKRRDDWLLGRWTAKQLLRRALAECRDVALSEIAVANDPDGAPYYCVDGQRLSLCLSISHRSGRALCALSSTHTVGADLEQIEPREPAFVEDFFTASESAQVWAASDATRDPVVTLIWSAKESALKVLREGLRIDTRKIEVIQVETIETMIASDVKCQTLSVKREDETDASVSFHASRLTQALAPHAWHPLHIHCHLPGAPRLAAWWWIDGDDVLTLAAAIPIGSTDLPEIRAV